LPGETLVCAGHEYTESNARFALSADPENKALQARAAEVKALRAAGHATLPVALASERECNPFLRAVNVEELGKLRSAKDRF
jgi:hydroxyacylglutathione hydrolase